ncbi:aromatic amino acid lyase [Paracoccus sp. Z330]|uniref:Aromatic amino acid lyase n=1 Tax=Paracoccus onchidii TaxID=3017813 RepID=A0ABT4ZB85_9RHOB|nr:aromatic amino acid ammonia-lyase [Paracoccus onchidii]MDB6176198.1 aromatic amino acid lyase [Paracoccus onchidii]
MNSACIRNLVAGVTAATMMAGAAFADDLVLDGANLTIEQVVEVARDPATGITIDATAQQRLQSGFDLVMDAATQGVAVYGLTVGVGWNKDRPAFQVEDGKRVLDDQLLDLSRAFNLGQLRAHAAGFGDAMDRDVVRAGMVVRLNQMLTGRTGIQPDIAEMYRQFLLHDIVPVVPERGSLGQADITLAAHVGLAMIGEWQVDYKGRRMPAAEALTQAELSPVTPVGKDFLSIISSNALTAGHAALLAHDADAYLQRQAVAFALALEGFNGNVAPFLEETTTIRPFPGMVKASAQIRDALDSSYLWQPSDSRGLQDPLSYRTMAYAMGSAIEASEALNAALTIQINHTDDNPATISGHQYEGASAQVEAYQVGDAGAIYPTANFELLPVGDKVEALNLALARVMRSAVMQTIRYENPSLTKLPRFLAAQGNSGLAFGALQVPLTALLAESRQLSLPVSLDGMGTSAGIEDVASNTPLAVANLASLIELGYKISSMQLLHAAQAVDLRETEDLGKATSRLLARYRQDVPFVETDRPFTDDIRAGVAVLQGFDVGTD